MAGQRTQVHQALWNRYGCRQRGTGLPEGPGSGSGPTGQGLDAGELRHSFVSVLSDAGIPVEEIWQLVGHRGTTVTELVNRHQLRPVIQTGALVMDRLFERGSSDA